ncbi:glycoside hydrolase family 3 C-terminal domain-containing protein [Paenibacillus sp. PR3]|uniref:Glycoside hydrolase family 3 C-terminal domain-containing protein n=1 Tax=Paenibacillus terricola TaxID=2763503 RepID=A0ABR8N0K3_9BACL|nr:glycoside hydrolase family 3 C-terminal domain-containing protein [Paenibacillus terricola]MBD3921725.1 glycoside hydrolase family 3 C-terminal domain-containing protein [Paenibacillus terricola]
MMKLWMNRLLTTEQRVKELLAAMTLDDKLALMNGGTPDEKLGIPTLKLNDGPGGVTGPHEQVGTQLPAPIALGASFNREAAHLYGEVIGKDAQERGTSLLLGPTVNMARTPLNGRTFEGYGEDPLLSAATGTAVIQGIQEQGVMACVKHYAANNQEIDRLSQNSIIDERTLREIYLPAFEAAVREGDVASIMSSYNRINGTYGSENASLLRQVLKDNWQFDGFVVSDFLATQSTVPSICAGLDYELTIPHKRFYGEPLKQAVEDGQVPMVMIDDSAGRILRQMLSFGLFDREQHEALASVSTPASTGRDQLDTVYTKHDEESLHLAEETIVLLQNNNNILPLSPVGGSIAVIGQAAENLIASGGGSAHVPNASGVTPLAAIEHRVSGLNAQVNYAPGTAPIPVGPSFIYPSPNAGLTIPPEAFPTGLLMSSYASSDLSGDPVHTQSMPNLRLNWQFDGVPHTASAKWTGTLTPTESEEYTFYLPASGGTRLYLDGELIIDNWAFQSLYSIGRKRLESGISVPIEVHYKAVNGEAASLPSIELEWYAGTDAQLIEEAVQTASAADTAIVFVNDYMTENFDKPDMSLPGVQNQLIAAVAAVNPNTIVVLNTGGPVTMPWLDQVAAVVQAWYPGQRGGEAIAKVLFGDTNPSGRLPMTFPKSLEQGPLSSKGQYPGIGLDTVYSEKLQVGYRWFTANEEQPLFPFGHGLSYTAFRYDAVETEQVTNDELPCFKVSFNITNVGERDGQAVPQLYISYPSAASEPPLQLKNYAKLEIPAGSTIRAVMLLTPRSFSIWNTVRSRWEVPEGAFTVAIGESSTRIVLEASVVPSRELTAAVEQCESILHGLANTSALRV